LSDTAFLVKSRKYAPGSHHIVAIDPATGEVTHCSECPGWHYRQSCTHAQAVQLRLERESRKSRPVFNVEQTTVETSTTGGQLYRTEVA
jgi:hypothetical protein